MAGFELPEEKRPVQRRAVRLELLTIAYLVSAVAFVYLTSGNSAAMQAAWIEDSLSLLPPLAFLVAARLRRRPASRRFPWGHHRVVSIAYLIASTALLALGSWVFIDGAIGLVTAERAAIGTIVVFDQQIWLGWAMLVACFWSGLPAFLLGRAKLPMARSLHDKVLYADAKMNRADWLTASAAALGVIGMGLGLWWTDPIAAMFIASDIVRDGVKNARAAVGDLMDSRPQHYDGTGPHELIGEAESALCELPWVAAARVRLREEGHVFAGEAAIVPDADPVEVARLEEAAERVRALDWRLYDIVVVPVRDVEDDAAGATPREAKAAPATD